MDTRKQYPCEIPGCQWTGEIRAKVKNPQSKHYGKKVCPKHSKIENNYRPKPTHLRRQTSKTAKKNRERTAKLAPFFDLHVEQIRKYPFSEESGARIVDPSSKNVAHIFPKRTYKSVEDHPANAIRITWLEHQRFDRLMDAYKLEDIQNEFPNTWEKICTRVKLFLPLVEEHGKLREEFEKLLS